MTDLLAPGARPGEGLIGTLALPRRQQAAHRGRYRDAPLAPVLIVAGAEFTDFAQALVTRARHGAKVRGERLPLGGHWIDAGPLRRDPARLCVQPSPLPGGLQGPEDYDGRTVLWACECGHIECSSTNALITRGRLGGVDGIWLSDWADRDYRLPLPPVFLPDAAWPAGPGPVSRGPAWEVRGGWVRLPARQGHLPDQARRLRERRQGRLPVDAAAGAWQWLDSGESERRATPFSLQAARRWRSTRAAAHEVARQAASALTDPWGKALDLPHWVAVMQAECKASAARDLRSRPVAEQRAVAAQRTRELEEGLGAPLAEMRRPNEIRTQALREEFGPAFDDFLVACEAERQAEELDRRQAALSKAREDEALLALDDRGRRLARRAQRREERADRLPLTELLRGPRVPRAESLEDDLQGEDDLPRRMQRQWVLALMFDAFA